jgi:arsenate reductase
VSSPLKRVLFVCIGNSCRSQMAEGFARAYGNDVLIAASAGVAPASRVAPDTLEAMDEKGIDLRDHFPKSIRHLGRVEFDLVVDMSGETLPPTIRCPIREWRVKDPVSLKYADHCAVRDDIERLVMELILELRREQPQAGVRPSAPSHPPL